MNGLHEVNNRVMILERQMGNVEHRLDMFEQHRHDDVAKQISRLTDAVTAGFAAVVAQLQILVNLQPGKAVDLGIVFGPKSPANVKESNPMAANKKATGPDKKIGKFSKKGGAKAAVMPDVHLTSPLPASMTLEALDASGGVVALTPADSVTTTLTSDSANFVISDGADSTHFVGTIPANTPQGSTANLAATMKGTIQGAAADLSASVKVVLDVPPAPTAVDMAIVFG